MGGEQDDGIGGLELVEHHTPVVCPVEHRLKARLECVGDEIELLTGCRGLYVAAQGRAVHEIEHLSDGVGRGRGRRRVGLKPGTEPGGQVTRGTPVIPEREERGERWHPETARWMLTIATGRPPTLRKRTA
ncbi:hypothetical protein [Streptomyces sp. NPDC059349]|uniref:hypothetical protein n=1 Tax=Streptomyces sp. NPDC059349 TaxID=3346808 RepID=UPI0036B8E810